MAALALEPPVRHLDAETKEWMDAAARGEAPWVCSDCGATCPNGMPVDCVYGHRRCTDILTRDRERAALSASSV